MSLLFQGFVQFFVQIFLRYFDVLINICEVSDLFHIVFEISVKNQNFSLTLLCLQTCQSLFWTQSNLRPQFIKKNSNFRAQLPAGSEPAALTELELSDRMLYQLLHEPVMKYITFVVKSIIILMYLIGLKGHIKAMALFQNYVGTRMNT